MLEMRRTPPTPPGTLSHGRSHKFESCIAHQSEGSQVKNLRASFFFWGPVEEMKSSESAGESVDSETIAYPRCCPCRGGHGAMVS